MANTCHKLRLREQYTMCTLLRTNYIYLISRFISKVKTNERYSCNIILMMSCVKVARSVIHCLFCSCFLSVTDDSIECIIFYYAPLCKKSLLWNYNFAGPRTQYSGKSERGQCATSASQTHLRRNVGISEYLWRTISYGHTYTHIYIYLHACIHMCVHDVLQET